MFVVDVNAYCDFVEQFCPFSWPTQRVNYCQMKRVISVDDEEIEPKFITKHGCVSIAAPWSPSRKNLELSDTKRQT